MRQTIIHLAVMAASLVACGPDSTPSAQQVAPRPAPATATATIVVDADASASSDATPESPASIQPKPASTPGRRMYAKTTPSGALQSDLLSAPCDPGQACEAHVLLPKGMHLIGKIALDGDTSFILASTVEIPREDTGQTELVVIAKNASAKPARMSGIFQYGNKGRQ